MPILESLRSQLAPDHVVRDAEYGRFRFLSMQAELLLLVTLAAGQGEVERGLAFVASDDTTVDQIQPREPAMGFRTQLQSVGGVARGAATTGLDATVLRGRLEQDRHFIVPVRKRQTAASLSEERITVGRAFNQDVVLRHASVSKFHAWIELDEERGALLTDAGSRNGTRLNDALLPARSATAIAPGDRLRFGSVAALLCDAETFLTVLTG